jgi:hypothetical protein
MNKTPNETTENTTKSLRKTHPRHPYMMSNSREETLRRMATVDERIAAFKEKLNAERKKNAS